ncbi:MAG: hypothetical protein JRG92_02430 [Deltaproteobacteria bacterium]|nr:hypothetical protein [Deltaproteobacteria bacterium]MBW2695417.1 hypothetical protein [Deltaproteobacteria bacterium]
MMASPDRIPAPLRRLGGLERFTYMLVLAAALAVLPLVASAGSQERAKRIHDRLVGIPPDAPTLATMVSILDTQTPEEGPKAAALFALEHPVFYTSTLKNFAAPWTNVDQTVFVPLNDYSATVIGMIRDEVPFNTVLSADLVYHGANGVVANRYSHDNNHHYEQLEADHIDLSDTSDFIGRPQSTLPGSQLSGGNTAGVITTRAAGEAYFSAGTNRRMWRFTAMNFLCRDMEDLLDTSLTSDWIRQDVTRSPGGDSSIFLNSCIGCHNGMDPMAGAYAYFEWVPGDDADADDNGRVIHTLGQVQPKYLINGNIFPFGYVTTSNRWENRWLEGKNSVMGWPAAPKEGFGAKGLGVAVGNSDAFATCQVEKVFKQICFREDSSDPDRTLISTVTENFKANDYNLKHVFAEVAAYCTQADATN